MSTEAPSNQRPVLSFGEVLIDFIVTDGAPSLDTANEFVARSGGAPANVTVALARLGLPSAFCGVVGSDPFGTRLRAELAAEGVDVSRLRDVSDAATTLAFAWKDARGDGHFWLLRGADTDLNPRDAESAGIPSLAAIVIGSVSLAAASSRATIERAVEIANASGVSVVFDVNLRPAVWADPNEAIPLCEGIARQSRLVKLSLDDAAGLFGAGITPEAAIDRVRGLGPAHVVLTDGERGCWFATADGKVCHVPAIRVQAVEPTGAGDAFSAALIARLLASGWAPLTETDVRYAAAAGALATTEPGAWNGLPNREQLDAFLQSA
ncbi:MAG: carbohydrate kinase [Thermomicrobiales bacterium]|nr:carbohydrate kinase [Thermomicrobiales bacterium]